jgi:peptide deformylase
MKRPLAYYTEPVLRQKAQRVEHIDDELRDLVADMIETMHANHGSGLAAPQVHQSMALFVSCAPFKRENGAWMPGPDRVFINPHILEKSEEMQTFTEGCLSIPHLRIDVQRPAKIRIQATDLEGHRFEETLEGFTATNFQHEYDHLQGILIIDYYTPEERKALQELFQASLEKR